jgi:multidrug efflux system membrane fusion protein
MTVSHNLTFRRKQKLRSAKVKRSAYFSIGLLGAVTAWMLTGSLLGASRTEVAFPASPATSGSQPMKVLVADLVAETVTRQVVVQGQLEPRRRVEIRAETAGQVIELPVEKGARVTKGKVIAKLAQDDRAAQLASAEAEVASRQLDLSASEKLGRKGMQAQTQIKSAQAALAAAEAELERLRIDLEHTSIRAPFNGVVETRAVEVGSLVERADPVVELVDASVLKAVGHVPQQSVGDLKLGQTVEVRLLDGRKAAGRITYLARVADSGTRSFRFEAEVQNADGALFSGVSAELRVAVSEEAGHFLSPAVLTLDDGGRVGVKVVEGADEVAFYPISLVRTEADGVWVSGLPTRVRVITRGQGFVMAGETVEPVDDGRSAS